MAKTITVRLGWTKPWRRRCERKLPSMLSARTQGLKRHGLRRPRKRCRLCQNLQEGTFYDRMPTAGSAKHFGNWNSKCGRNMQSAISPQIRRRTACFIASPCWGRKSCGSSIGRVILRAKLGLVSSPRLGSSRSALRSGKLIVPIRSCERTSPFRARPAQIRNKQECRFLAALGMTSLESRDESSKQVLRYAQDAKILCGIFRDAPTLAGTKESPGRQKTIAPTISRGDSL